MKNQAQVERINYVLALALKQKICYVVSLYDLFVLDIGITCHDKRVRIPGTEDMEKEYRQIGHHVKGAVKGTILGAVVSLFT